MTKIQLQHRTRCFLQYIKRPELAVVGQYHGGNLGDMCLGMSVTSRVRQVVTGMQSISNLTRWPDARFAILGGGAIGYNDSLEGVYDRYKNRLHNVGLLGVDFNEKIYSKKSIKLIRKAAWVSCRSEKQAKLIEIIREKAVSYHPDIAFSLQNEAYFSLRQSDEARPRRMLINVIPLYGEYVGRRLRPTEIYRKERPLLYNNFKDLHSKYREVIRNTVKMAMDEGYAVESMPFTPEDEAFGRAVLDGLQVEHVPYSCNPSSILHRMKNAQWIVCTRYHATIFGFKAGLEVSPIAYARKSEESMRELGLSQAKYVTPEDLLENGSLQCMPRGTVLVDIEQQEHLAQASIDRCVAAVVGN